MKLRNLFVGALTAVFALAGCQEKEQNLGTPDISISTAELTFDVEGGEQAVTVNATRDWKVETDADWVVVDPASGEASADDQIVTVSVLENTGMDRTADIKFTIGMKSKYLTVSQAGPGGSAEALIVFYNDYDKVEAEKTYGSGSSWPYLDQFDGWMNQTGTGAENVEYAYSGMSARANSTSDSNYSDYPGSGKNNMFFGKSAYLATKNIALGGATNFTLTFGSEKYSQDGDSVFKNAEFHVYLSNDAAKWVEVDYIFAGTEGGRWNLAAADFSVPAGTENLSVCVKADVASVYRMDDMKLVISEGGAEVDFSKGVEMDFTAGGSTGGGSTTAPESKGKKTVEEFIAAADTQNYYELTGTVSGFNPTYCSFDLTDATGKIYVYSVLDASKTEWTSKISNGGTITIYGKYLYYEQKSQHEVVDAYIVSFEGDGSGSTASGKPESLTKATVAEFLAAEESSSVWYELTGEIISIAKQDYGNFTIKDATGEIYIYGMTSKWVGSNDKSFSQIGLKVGDTVTLGTLRGSYNGEPQGGGNPVPAFYISHVPGEGGEVVTPPAGEAGEYDPQGVTWTLGEKAYDNTSGSNAQKGTVNGVSVANMLKLGTGSLVGDATLHVAAGTKKLGFYCVAWKDKTAQVKFSVDGTEVTTITPAANTGATGNPPYTSITVTESDYYEVDLPSGATDVKVETLDPSNGRVLFIGLKAITE